MLPSAIRPPVSRKLIRVAAALVESSLLLVVGALPLSGFVRNPDAADPDKLPLRFGFSVLPIVLVIFVYAFHRIFRKQRRFAFVMAGALVSGLGGAFAPGLEPLSRIVDALRGLVVGAIFTGFIASVDDDGAALLEGGAQPWRELFMAFLLVVFGAMPSAIFGGFVLAWADILVGMVLLVRCMRYDAPVVVPRKSAGAAFRVFLALLFMLLALGFLVVCPMISLGMKRLH